MTGYREPPVPPLKYDPDTLVRMQELWENAPELSAAKIAARFDKMTKNIIIGQANRRNWKPRRSPVTEPTTLHQRMDALKAEMERVLAETRPFVEDRKPTVIRVWPDDPERRLKAAARLRAMNGRGMAA